MTGKNIIGFALSGEGDKTFRTTNPRNGQFTKTLFFEATSKEVELAVSLANQAFPIFNGSTFVDRAKFLSAIADKMELLGDDLLNLFSEESGLPVSRAKIERTRTVNQLRSFAEAVLQGDWLEASIDTADPNSNPPKPDIRKMLTGIGPVVVFGASNFPLAYSTAGGDTASAFAAGCPVIVKSHPMHAGTGEMVANAIMNAAKETGMPEGVFSNLNASSFNVGQQLVQHPFVKAVGFTGSINGGRALFDLAASRPEPIPVFAEMGSVNPILLTPSVFEHGTLKIAEQLVDSMTQSVGQFCTNPGLIFVPKTDQTDSFLKTLEDMYLSREAQVMLHSEIHEKFEYARLSALKNEGIRKIEKTGTLGLNTARNTILLVSSDQFKNQPTLHHEVFGPFSVIVEYETIDELINCLELLEGQLTSSIFGSEEALRKSPGLIQLLQRKAGRLIFNGVPTGVTVCPSMNHGGPYPASTDSRFTAVGIDSMRRFLRPVAYQNCPKFILPEALSDKNSLGIARRVNGLRHSEDLCS